MCLFLFMLTRLCITSTHLRMRRLLRTIIAYSFGVLLATVALPVIAAWILTFTNSLANRYLQNEASNDGDSLLALFHNTKLLFNDEHNIDDEIRIGGRHRDHSANYLAPYVMPPIAVTIYTKSSEESDDDEQTGRGTKNPGTKEEGLASLRAANAILSTGNARKAQRLFEHAMALSPNNPDVLTSFGVFSEQAKRDLVRADYLYTRALIFCPDHSVARMRRRKTLPLVRDIDNRMLQALDRKRQRFLGLPRDSVGFHEAARDAYVRYIYHTVAIEGNSMSLKQTRSILETRLAIGGKSVLEHNEILGVDAALRYINSSLVFQSVGAITIDDILEIHRRVLGFVDPIGAGRFRKTQVYVGRFEPPPPETIESEMEQLVEWLRSETTLHTVHPVEIAALAHYKLTYAHPFLDGNGRTARLLMNLILMQAGFPPVLVRLKDRQAYYETLKAANDGDVRPFIRFIARCTDRTLDEYLQYVDRTTTIFAPDSLRNPDSLPNATSMDELDDEEGTDYDDHEWTTDGRLLTEISYNTTDGRSAVVPG